MKARRDKHMNVAMMADEQCGTGGCDMEKDYGLGTPKRTGHESFERR
jgi:hypothetical protein